MKTRRLNLVFLALSMERFMSVSNILILVMETVARINEPLHGYVQEIALIPVSRLKVIEVQRKPSTPHVKRLKSSIKKIGFTIPLIVVRRGEDNIIIDGQHRFLAAKELGIKELPAIIIPEKYAHNLMELNVEKQMSLRERAYVALNVYRMYLDENPSIKEDDGRIMDSIEYAYYVTLGIAYEKKPRVSGSPYEPLLKKVDGFLPKPLKDAVSERERRAGVIVETDELTREVVRKVRELGLEHEFIYNEVVSFCNPMKRKRKVSQSFDNIFSALQKNLRDLAQNPERILKK
ncbi:MAG: ParB N-terminal domain-containing protein [Thermoproteota archaeon]